jgi:D-aminopeptidase
MHNRIATAGTIALAISALSLLAGAHTKPRARDLGIPFEGATGLLNAITDVKGIEVGHTTLISGSGALMVGIGPVRTGVTAVLPRGKKSTAPVFAGWFSLNGSGEMTGTAWVEESGIMEGPIVLTNTYGIGVARDSVTRWMLRRSGESLCCLPVVAETFDGRLNDISGFHVKEAHVLDALDSAKSGPVTEGNVGGGTGMICYGFKGGIGTSSRKLSENEGGYTVGVLVQANFGARRQLRIAGVPVGLEISEDSLVMNGAEALDEDTGSIIIIIATDAPLLPHQLKRLARRAPLGLARTGSTSGNTSGDIFLAFSSANAELTRAPIALLEALNNRNINPLSEAVVQATEEAIVNALVAAETMTGINNNTAYALPHERLRQVLRKYGRLSAGKIR